MTSAASVALEAHRAGLCVVPPREDGSKAPSGSEWTTYQQRRPTETELRGWYANGRAGVGIVCGAVSGNLEVFDFDEREAFDEFCALAEASGLGEVWRRCTDGYLEETPTGGAHIATCCSTIAGNMKLARRPKREDEKTHARDTVKVRLETRGEGGYIVTAPSGGGVHPSGRPYRLLRGSFATIARITPEERGALLDLARSLDRMPRPEPRREEPRPPRASGDDLRPGDDFNARASWAEVLEPHGWRFVFERGGETYWCRPGKAEGVSATTNYRGSGLLYVFSSSTEFEMERGYDLFGAFALLEYGGDLGATARALAARGFGSPRPVLRIAGRPVGTADSEPDPLGGNDDLVIPSSARPYRPGEPPPPGDGDAPPPRAASEADTLGAGGPESEDFAPFLPLAEVIVPPFPIDALPHWLRDFAAAVAEATQTPPDLAGVLGLGAVATACAGRARVLVRAGYFEPLNIFGAVAMPPASRKTEVFRVCSAPLAEWERDMSTMMRPEVARAAEQLEQMRARLEKLRRKAAGDDGGLAAGEALDLAEKIAAQEVAAPVLPRLVTDDCTPEGLAALLERHHGRMASWGAEGGELFAMAAGRYSASGAPNLGVYLQAHAGDPIRVDRKRGCVHVERPALTVMLAIQPGVIRALRESPSAFRERGLLARFLYSMPPSTVGRRDWEASPVPDTISEGYRDSLRALLDWRGAEAVIELEPAALALWLEFARALEPRLAEDGDLGPLSDWCGKLPGLVARLAGLLSAAEWADRPDPYAQPIDRLTMERALDLGAYALEHARAAFLLMAVDPREAGALKVWRYVARRALAEVTHREAWQAVKGGRIGGTEDFEAALGVLVSRGYLRPTGGNRAGPRAFRVNHDALAHGVGGDGGSNAG